MNNYPKLNDFITRGSYIHSQLEQKAPKGINPFDPSNLRNSNWFEERRIRDIYDFETELLKTQRRESELEQEIEKKREELRRDDIRVAKKNVREVIIKKKLEAMNIKALEKLSKLLDSEEDLGIELYENVINN